MKIAKIIMKNLKISQIQFQAKAKPDDNCNQLESYYKKALKFRPDIICTPECSNIITNDKKHLFKFSTYQNECPILSMSKNFAKRHKLFINICLLYTSPSPRDQRGSRMPSSA